MEELDIKQIFKFTYQRKNILIYILLISIVVGALYTFVIKRPKYESKAQILIDKADASIEKYIVSKDVLKSENIDVKFDKTSKIITAVATNTKKDSAFNEINSYIDTLEDSLQATYGTKTFKMLETPQAPTSPSNATYLKDIAICVLVGIVGFAVYIIVLLNISGMVSESEIENLAKINVLGKVSLEKKKNKKETIKYTTSNINISNQLKRIEANIELNKEKSKTILFTGVGKQPGTTYIVNNLAIQFAKIYNKVLVIDANIFTKTLSKEYNLEEKNGLTNIIDLDTFNDIENIIQKTEKENIYVLPVGNVEVEEEKFLQSNVKELLKILENNYDIILIDTASVNEKVLPIVLTNIVDTTIIVAQEQKTNIEDIENAKATIEKVGGKTSGVILNKVI